MGQTAAACIVWAMLRPLLAAAVLAFFLLPAAAGSGEDARRSLTQCLADQLCFQGLDFGDRFELRFENRTDERYTVAASVRALDGTDRTRSQHIVTEMPERRLLLALAFPPDKAAATWEFTYHLGTTPAQHDDGHVYRLPYVSGSSHIVLQGHDGDLSHKGALRFAVDWRMPEGTAVLAARAGVVIGTYDQSDVGGTEFAMYGRENYVWLRHDDGTVGQYLHLATNSVTVAIGDSVEAGQFLARSGNTGYSDEPHLHFHVSSPAPTGPYAFETFPARFRLAEDHVGVPARGRRYLAP